MNTKVKGAYFPLKNIISDSYFSLVTSQVQENHFKLVFICLTWIIKTKLQFKIKFI